MTIVFAFVLGYLFIHDDSALCVNEECASVRCVAWIESIFYACLSR